MRFKGVLNVSNILCKGLKSRSLQVFSLKRSRKMATGTGVKSDHLDRTKANSRTEVVSLATVIGMRDESKTVKSITLKVHDKDVSFKAGQWLDMFIPGVDTVGGFSMYSSPVRLQESQQLDLAVKYSNHPPAYWLHTQCKEGSQVQLRVGGDFYFDPVAQHDQDLLLVAGGVGINPMYSIVNHMTDLHKKGQHSNGLASFGRVMLLYSSRTMDELIFKSEIDGILAADSNIQCQYFVTRGDNNTSSSNCIADHRINTEDIAKCFDWLRKDRTLAYICGPSPMINDVEIILKSQQVEKSNIHYEKWW